MCLEERYGVSSRMVSERYALCLCLCVCLCVCLEAYGVSALSSLLLCSLLLEAVCCLEPRYALSCFALRYALCWSALRYVSAALHTSVALLLRSEERYAQL